MKTAMKKIFSLMLVAVLLISAVPFQASADEVSYNVKFVVKDTNGNELARQDELPEVTFGLTAEDYLHYYFSPAWAESYTIEKIKVNGTEIGTSYATDAADVEDGFIKLGIFLAPIEVTPPAPQPCATCGNAAHEGVCCATCKQIGHAASAHCSKCGQLGHAAADHCSSCDAVGTHTAGCPTVQPADEYVTFVYTPIDTTVEVKIENGKVTAPSGKAINGYRFDGWQYAGGLKDAGASISVSGPTTIYAYYTNTNPTETYELNVYVRRYVGKVLKATSLLKTWNTMQENDNVLDWLDDHKAELRTLVESKYPGYDWSGKFYNFHNNELATSNAVETDGQRNIYINVYGDQENVLVYVHLDNNKKHSTLIELNGYAAGKTVTAKAALTAVQKHYNVSELTMYSESGWEEHLDGKKPVSTKGVVVEEGTTKIHVNLKSANITTGSGSSSSTSKADTTNPKTGDMIFMPAAVMGLSASVLAVLFFLNKKRAY